MVLGEGAMAPYDQDSHRMGGLPMTTSHYMFTYTLDTMRVVLSTPKMEAETPEAMDWGVAMVEVVSLVANFAPVAEDMQVFMPADPSGGVNTIELRGHDDECGELEYTLTSLPTEGKVFLCSCENIWTKPVLEVPQSVAGPCHRLVYQPQANMPAGDADGSKPFDHLTYTVTDAAGAASAPATVSLYVMPSGDDTCEAPPCSVPSAGKPGLALAFDGESSILTLGDAEALKVAPPALSLESWFKLKGAAGGVLLAKAGSYRLGWTRLSGLGCEVMTTLGMVGAATPLAYDDHMWHHAACTYHPGSATVSLYVDGHLAATGTADRPAPPASNYGAFDPVPLHFDAHAVATAGATASLDGDGFFFGYLDEVRVWAVALTAHEVMANMMLTEEMTGLEKGLLCYYPMNDMAEGYSAGTFVWDKSATM
eukprot:CAMPEP_0118950692 /NCGR_PEP_ID=MMETSP1169-20130426/51837_1 /TAXON_ID=36882 /ORGANISM="Pyramimonas obovata, Strain CCMP722" /LENGTH=423 /DNA_ID=CAMNT_0006897587 /DNA_START=1 /DNA_END=1269 /DNA_ORIENTATION=-